jgi:hypothetical protein
VEEDTRYDQLLVALRRNAEALERAEQGVSALQAMVEALVEILIARGELAEGHARLLGKLRQHARRTLGQTVRLRSPVDKYAVAGAAIDCDSRLHLCHGRCCSFTVEMSLQDLEEGSIAWNIREPYMLRREADGFCTHLDREDGGCTIYEQRPAACREFDCRQDSRVWVDFDAMAPAPMPEGLRALPCTRQLVRRQDR